MEELLKAKQCSGMRNGVFPAISVKKDCNSNQ